MKLLKLKLKIGPKLFIGFSILVMVFTLSQWYAIGFMRNYSLNQVNTLISEKAFTATIQIDNFFNQIDTYNAGLGSLYNESTSSAKLVAASQFILENNLFIKKIVFLKLNGRELVKIEQLGKKVNDALFFEIITDSFEQALAGQTAISKVFFVDEEPGPFINVFTPIRSGNEVTAVIKMQISLVKMWDIISRINLGKTGYAYVVDNDGRLIAHRNLELVLKSPILTSRNVLKSALHNNILKNWPGDYEYVNEENIPVVSQISRIDRVNWLVVFEQSTNEAYSFMNFLVPFFTISLLLSISAIIIISYLLSRDILISIRKLRQGAQRLEAEDLKSKIQLNTGDEFEELGHTFNSMVTKLDRSFTQIEEQRQKANKTAELLLRRDSDLRIINDELQVEKDHIKVEKDKFMVVLSGITDAVIALDLHYRIVTFNSSAEKLTGRVASEVIGKSINTVIKVFDKDHELEVNEYCPIENSPDESIIFKKKYLKIVSGDKQAFVDLVVGKINDNMKNNLAGILSIHDLTEEQRLEEMKLDFVSMAAHELRTPLTSIRGYLSLYMEENKNELKDEQKFLLNRVDISCQQLGSLVENLLSVSRIEKGAFSVNLKPVDWNSIVKPTFEQLIVRAKEKNIKLTYDEPAQTIIVLADKLRITEVVTNLLANAITYTPASGSVRLWMEIKGNEVLTHITDTGEGIAADAIPHLFSKFFRVSGVLSQGSKGTGLGLYISKAIVEKHNGRIWVESEAGKGSTFSFSTPIYDENNPPVPDAKLDKK